MHKIGADGRKPEPAIVRTIDITPTWSGILPALELALMHGSAEGRKMAREELARMAALADRYVAEHKGKAS
jgi:hypothetical protein